jgi:hypothetical protein
MKIEVASPCCYKGDVYRFTDDFEEWLGHELGKCVDESEAFAKKYGKDWKLILGWETGRRIKKTRLGGPWVDRKYKQSRWLFELPGFRYTSPDAKTCVPVLREFLKNVASVLSHEGIDTSRLEKQTNALLKRFVSRPGMLEHDPHPYTFGTPDDPYGLEREKRMTSTEAKPKSKGPAKFVKRNLPPWKIPGNIQKRVEAEDGLWESERYDPILLNVMSGTSYHGRAIPLAWQIEFDPDDDRLAAANETMEASGIEPDGDGWSSVIEKKFAKRYPKLAREFHSDSESSTCVVWVESETACQKLIEVVWSLMHPDQLHRSG